MTSSRESIVLVRPSSGATSSCSLDEELHLANRRGRHKYDWETYHAQYVVLWATCAEKIITTPPTASIMDFHDPYMEWYQRITQRLITQPLHRDKMRFHNIVATSHLLASKRL